MPQTRLDELLKKEMTRKQFLWAMGIGFASTFGILGIISQLLSRAATPTKALEAEGGTKTGKATSVADSAASGGNALKFGAATTTPPPPPPTTTVGATGGTGVQPTGTESNTGAPISRYQDLAVKGSATASGPNGRISATVAACPTKGVSFAPGNFTFYDFLDPDTVNPFGIYFRPNITAVVGSGSNYTNFVLAANSQTGKAPTSGTNQMNKIRIGSNKITLKGITFPFTAQPSMYNGVFLYKSLAGSLVEDVVIRGCPGSSSVPPGETFLLNDYKGDGLTMTNIELDGRNSSGTAVAATLFGSNSSTNYTNLNNMYFHDTAYGAGFTQYLSQGVFTFNNCKFENIKGAGANFEQFGGSSSGATASAVFNNCQWINCGNDLIMDNTYRSTKCVINEPILASGQKIRIKMHANYSYNLPSTMPNLQKQSDITLIYKGQVRNDLIAFV